MTAPTPSPRKTRAKGNGNGTVWERGDGKHRWEVTVGFDPSGKRIRRGGVCSTKKAAEKAVREALSAKDAGRLAAPDRTTLEEWVNRWLERREGRVSAKTGHNQRALARLYVFPTLGKKPLQGLTKKHLQDLYDSFNLPRYGKAKDRPLSASMQRQVHNILRPALQEALVLDILSRNPALEIKPNPLNKSTLRISEAHVWTVGEAGTFLKAARADRYGLLFEFLLLTGTRKGEALGLRWENVQLEVGYLLIAEHRGSVGGVASVGDPKTEHSRRRIYLSPDLRALLERVRAQQAQDAKDWRQWWAVSGYVFTHERTGKPLHPENLGRSFKRITALAGVKPITLHGLRHTHASLAAAQGVKPEVLSKQLGHKRVSFTLDVYRTVYESEREDYALELGLPQPDAVPLN